MARGTALLGWSARGERLGCHAAERSDGIPACASASLSGSGHALCPPHCVRGDMLGRASLTLA
jgi:hypothetical protein